MGKYRIERYSSEHQLSWNEFLAKSRNGIFLFDRNFMDYHSDRFEDHSLVIFESNSIEAIFVANQKSNQIIAHQGLTFGGLILSEEARAIEVQEMIELIYDYYKSCGVTEIILKPIPFFLHRLPSGEDLYFWHQKGAINYRRDLSSLIDLSRDYKYSKGRKWVIGKAKKSGVSSRECDCWSEFYQVLSNALLAHGTKPVHSLTELLLLSSRFPDNIKLFGSFDRENNLLAGALVFLYGKTMHTQYLANSEKGRDVGALDLLLADLIDIAKKENFLNFSFGISTINEGREVNYGLLQQKESYGGRAVLHDWYRVNL